jgi:hypothetical protein
MGIFDAGKRLMDSAFEYAGVRISYRGAGYTRPDVRAKTGKTVFKFVDASGITIRTEQQDFMIRACDLSEEPANGDIITMDGEMYIVTSPNDEPCWRWHSSQNRDCYRIHTKRLSK